MGRSIRRPAGVGRSESRTIGRSGEGCTLAASWDQALGDGLTPAPPGRLERGDRIAPELLEDGVGEHEAHHRFADPPRGGNGPPPAAPASRRVLLLGRAGPGTAPVGAPWARAISPWTREPGRLPTAAARPN